MKTSFGFARAVVVAMAAPVIVIAAGQDRRPQAQPWAGDRFDVMEKTIPELQDAMARGTITSRELVEIYMARIDAYDRGGPRINAFIAVNPHAADEAAALDRERASRGSRGPLHGIPVVVKDNFNVVGLPTTAGTLAFADLYPAEDATQVRKLREAGAVILGKTNLHELASGITTISSMGGQTRNPYDLARNPGGSSGGTGAAVAANFAAAGLGSDTCGSIRIPSSHNALVGMRSTLGLSSRDGVVPLSHSQDVAGPLARTVTDVAILLDATAGVDPADAVTKLGEGHRPPSYRDSLKADALKGARIGVLTSLFGTAPEDNETGALVRRALDEMKKQGADVLDVSVPGLDELLSGSSVIDAEFKFDLADFLAKIPNAPFHSLGEILDLGLYHAAIDASMRRRNAVQSRETDSYRRALIKRETVRQAVTAALEEQRLDALAYPTMRRKPALVGEAQAGSTCQLSATAGLPALTMPAGFTADLLPTGIELVGRAFAEPRLLALAYAFEQSAHVRRPPFSAPALTGRKAPVPIAFESVVTLPGQTTARPPAMTVRFTFDPLTGTLQYRAATAGLVSDDVRAAWVHRGGAGEHGPAVYQLLGRAELQGSGTVTLPPAEHARLREGRFYLALYTRDSPRGDARTQLLAK